MMGRRSSDLGASTSPSASVGSGAMRLLGWACTAPGPKSYTATAESPVGKALQPASTAVKIKPNRALALVEYAQTASIFIANKFFQISGSRLRGGRCHKTALARARRGLALAPQQGLRVVDHGVGGAAHLAQGAGRVVGGAVQARQQLGVDLAAGVRQRLGALGNLVQCATGLVHAARHALELGGRGTHRVGAGAQALGGGLHALEGGIGLGAQHLLSAAGD